MQFLLSHAGLDRLFKESLPGVPGELYSVDKSLLYSNSSRRMAIVLATYTNSAQNATVKREKVYSCDILFSFFFTWFSAKSFYHVKKSTFYYSEIAVVSSLLHHVTFLHFLSHCDAFIQLSRSNCPPSWLINMCKCLANLPDVTDSIAWITTYPAG